MAANERKVLRCAVYTRKSSEHGLEQDFNSLDAQREAAEAYIKSQAHEGWRCLKTHYDDGGISGGTLERPALQSLLADIESRKVDVVVVYKVDRLTRSLADFAKLVELFEAHGVSFVAVTQQFNTTTSMGRLTLNVLLSFAQFERELAGERIRDKFAASRRKGMWMGGTIPLGYEVKDHKLVINQEEADRVRLIFQQYLALGCVAKLRADLEQRGVRSKQRSLAPGRVQGGGSFWRGALYHLLKNRIYRGEVVHKGTVYPGEHKAIVDEELWSAVQARLADNRTTRRKSRVETGALLAGLIYDDRGNIMSPSYSVRRGNRYRDIWQARSSGVRRPNVAVGLAVRVPRPAAFCASDILFGKASHKLSPFKGFNVLSRQGKPLTFGALHCKPSVPIVFDPVRIVCRDRMNQL